MTATLLVGIWALVTTHRLINSKLVIVNYNRVHSSFSKLMISLHFLGAVCYIFIAQVVSVKFVENTNNESSMRLILFTGFLFGIIYNIYGYFSDMRLDWSKVFKQLSTVNISKEPYVFNTKLNYFIYSVILQGIVAVVVLCCSIYIIYNFNYKLLEDETIDGVIAYSTFATLYCSIIVLYFKQMYNLFFSSKYRESIIFPKFEDFK